MKPAAGGTAGPKGLGALATLVLGASCIGFSGVFVRFADVGASALGFWRMAFALPFLTLWALRERAADPAVTGGLAPGSRPWGVAILAGIAFALDVFLFHLAVGLTTIAKASLLGNAAPIILAAMGLLFFRDRPSRAVLAALALASLGIALLMKPDALAQGSLQGDLAGMGAAVTYALYLVAIQQARQRGAASGWVSLVSSLSCAVVCLALALALGEAIVPRSLQGWLSVMALGMVSHALGQGLITVGLGGVSPSLAAVVLIYPAIVSATAAWIVFGEVPTALQALGGGLILAALVMARRG